MVGLAKIGDGLASPRIQFAETPDPHRIGRFEKKTQANQGQKLVSGKPAPMFPLIDNPTGQAEIGLVGQRHPAMAVTGMKFPQFAQPSLPGSMILFHHGRRAVFDIPDKVDFIQSPHLFAGQLMPVEALPKLPASKDFIAGIRHPAVAEFIIWLAA
ncbi:MAG: hypothetical protein WC076_12605 [Terrimicrobiaceae bacterium]